MLPLDCQVYIIAQVKGHYPIILEVLVNDFPHFCLLSIKYFTIEEQYDI